MRTVAALAVPPRASTFQATPSRRQLVAWQQFEEPAVDGVLQFARVTGLGIGRVRAGVHRVLHDPRRARLGGGTDLHVILQVRGSDTLEQSGQLLTLRSGQWAVLAGEHVYTITSRDRTERLVMVIGRERLTADIKTVTMAARACSAVSGPGRLFFSTAVCFADELPQIRVDDARPLAEQLASLLDVALRYETEVGALEYSDIRREQVYQYIAKHLRDPQLSVEHVAAGLGWSRRTLARLLETNSETLMQYVYRERLEGSRRDLLNPMLEEQTLAGIAHSWGFRNYSHFSDRFRSYFGLSPTAVRRHALLMYTRLDGSSGDQAAGDQYMVSTSEEATSTSCHCEMHDNVPWDARRQGRSS